jgi:hypothetical protein
MFCKYRRNGECFIRALYNGRLMGDPGFLTPAFGYWTPAFGF